VALSNRHLH